MKLKLESDCASTKTLLLLSALRGNLWLGWLPKTRLRSSSPYWDINNPFLASFRELGFSDIFLINYHVDLHKLEQPFHNDLLKISFLAALLASFQSLSP